MTNQTNKSYFAVIPANVRYDKDLSANAKLLYGELTALCNEKGYCWATNAYFADLYDVNIRTIQKWLTQLTEKNYIFRDIEYKENSLELSERKIYIVQPTQEEKLIEERAYVFPHALKDTTPMKIKTPPPCPKRQGGHAQKDTTPHAQKGTLNNTVINNTINNTVNNKKTNKKNPAAAELNLQIENEFEEFWKAYPRKGCTKKTAKTSFIKARKKNKVTYETIMNGLYKYISYIEENNTEDNFIAHASTWLNQERWENEYLAIRKKKKMSNYMDLLDPDFGGNFNEHGRDTKIVDCDTSFLPYP